jgi:hypothetical protein
MNRIARMVKVSGLVVAVAVVASYLGATAALNLAQRDSQLQRAPVYQLVDGPKPCGQC